VVFRPELRYEHAYNAPTYDNGTKKSQLMFAADMIFLLRVLEMENWRVYRPFALRGRKVAIGRIDFGNSATARLVRKIR
jgi:hypothetical protein